MQSPESIPDIVAPPTKPEDWESHSVASTPLPNQNLGFLIPQEDTRPRPRSAGGSNRPTKNEEVGELVRFFETHDGPDVEQEQQIHQQNSRSYNIARELFKAGHRRLRRFGQPKPDRWVKRETVEGRTYRYIAVPNRISILGHLEVEEGPEVSDAARLDGGPRVMNGDGSTSSVSSSGPAFLGEIKTRHEDTDHPGDRFYPGIGELPSLMGLPLSSARDATSSRENGSQILEEINEPQNSVYDSTPSLESEHSNQERIASRVRFNVGTTGAVASKTAPRHRSATINGFKNHNDDRHEVETKKSEVSITPSSEDEEEISTLLLRTTKSRPDTTVSTETKDLNHDASFRTGSSESSSSTPVTKSFILGTSRSSPSTRSSPRRLNPRTSLQSIHEKSTWRRPTAILQQNSSSKTVQDRSPRSNTASSLTKLAPTSTYEQSLRSTSQFEEPFLSSDMTSSPLMQGPTGPPGTAQSQYTFPDLEIDNSKNRPSSSANNVPYNGSSRSPPRPAPTKPLPSLPKNKTPRSSTYSRENDGQIRSRTQPNGSLSNIEASESQASSGRGKLAKSPSKSIRRTRSALSRSHNKLHEVSTPTHSARAENRSDDGVNQQASSTPSMNEQKLSAERQERINRAERVYAVRMKDICAARARLENKMLEVREAGGDAMADEFTLSETRLLNNREAEGEAEREPEEAPRAPLNSENNRHQDGNGNNNDRNAMFSRLPSTTPSPPPKVPLPADPPHSLLGAFSIETILRGSSKPPQRSLEMSPVMTVYEQWPTVDDNLTKPNSVYRSNSKTGTPYGWNYHQQNGIHRDNHVPRSRWDRSSNARPRPSTILTNGKATPPRSTSPSLASLDGEQPGQRAASTHATTSDREWNHFNHNQGYSYGTPERQINELMTYAPMPAIPRDDYIPPLSPRARSTHSRAKTSESHVSESRHQQPHPHPQPQPQHQNSNTIQSLESRVALLERQNKMLQAALMSALDVGVTLDAEHVRSGTPMRTATTTDSYDFGHGPNPRLKRNSNIISRRPNSWLSVRSAQSRRSMGATSSGSEGAGVKAIEAMIGNLELGWSGDRQSVGDGECNTAQGQRA